MDATADFLRPYLLPLTTNLPAPLVSAGHSLLGRKCYKTLLLDVSPSPPCLRLALSKTLGIGIITLSSVVKIPQILKLLTSQSSSGLSFLAYLLETVSYGVTLAYSARKGFPFSTYGETALIAAQDLVIGCLVLHFEGRDVAMAAFAAGVVGGVGALMGDKGPVDMGVLGTLQAGAGALGVASKVPQIWTVWRNGGTGQLSAFAVFTYLFGSLSRIFTTVQEVDDKLILYGFVAGFLLNAVLALQMLYYWRSPATASHAGEMGQKPKQVAMGTSTGASVKPKTPTTRRRG